MKSSERVSTTVWLSVDLAEQLRTHVFYAQTTRREVIEEALRKHLNSAVRRTERGETTK
jgi:hypothetical protein